jgi:Protein of unknown function (DUF2934)
MKLNTSRRKSPAALSRNDQGAAEHPSNHLHARVAELAYSLYEQRGRQDGHDVEDWIQAEQTLLAAHNQAVGNTLETPQAVVSREDRRTRRAS